MSCYPIILLLEISFTALMHKNRLICVCVHVFCVCEYVCVCARERKKEKHMFIAAFV